MPTEKMMTEELTEQEKQKAKELHDDKLLMIWQKLKSINS